MYHMVICKETYHTVAVDIYSYKFQISPDYNITGHRARPLKPSDNKSLQAANGIMLTFLMLLVDFILL